MAIGSSIIGALRVVLGMDVAEFEEGSKRAQSSMDKLAQRAEKLGEAIGAAFVVDKIGGFAAQAIKEFGAAENAIRSVEAAIKSSGGTAGFTSQELAKMAAKLQSISTFGDDDILNKVTANLLTFGNVVGPVFDKAQLSILNLSARLGQDLQSSTIMVGKALNNPIEGLSSLARVGVKFTDAQKDMIKSLVASNKVMDAQKIILDELEKEFGGQAEAIANTTQGKLTQAANAFGDAMEVVGSLLAPVVLPMADGIKRLSEEFQTLDPKMQTFIVTAGAVAAAFAVATAAGIAFAAVFGTISLPVIAVVAAVSAVVAAIYTWREQLGDVASVIGGHFSGIYQTVKTYFGDGWTTMFTNVQAVISWFVDRFVASFNIAKLPLLALIKIVTSIYSYFYSFRDTVLSVVSAISKAFVYVYESAYEYLYSGIKAVLEKVNSWFKALAKTIDDVSVSLGLKDTAANIEQSAGRITSSLKPITKELVEAWQAADKFDEVMKNLDDEHLNQKRDPSPKRPPGFDPNAAEKARKAQAELNKVIQEGVNLVKKAEAPWDKYTRQMNNLNAAYKAGKISAKQLSDTQKQMFEEAKLQYEGGAELIQKYQSPYEQMQDTVARLNEQYKAGAISAMALGRAQEQAALVATSAYVDMASSIGSSLSQVFKKSKAIAIATGVIDAISSALKALSAYPPPYSFIAAAAALAAGMAKVAAIRSTSESSSSAGSGGSSSSSSSGSSGSSTAAAATQQQGVYITLQGEKYGREQVRGLIEQINSAVADGAVLRVA